MKQLLLMPRRRVTEYYRGLRELRRLLPKKSPLEQRIRELLPAWRNVRETSDNPDGDDTAPEDTTGDAPPSPPPEARFAAPTTAAPSTTSSGSHGSHPHPPVSSPPMQRGPPPRIAARVSPLGPPPQIVPGRGVAPSAKPNEKPPEKDKKFALFGKGRPSPAPAGAAGAPKLFGVPLIELASRERRAVPIFVSVLCNIIEAKGLSIEGIFRTNESKPVENAARERLERGDPPAQACADPVVAASLIKMWLRELPDPLLTFAAYDKFIAVGQALNDARATKLLFQQMIADLPAPHRACTLALLAVCKFITENESVNKMSAKNLAIVLAPNMLRPRADQARANHTKMVAEMQDAVNIVAAMISLHETQPVTETPSTRAALTGAPLIVGGDSLPDVTQPPADAQEDAPPPPEPAEDDTADEPSSSGGDPDASVPPAPDAEPPPLAQRPPVMSMQEQKQRALASELLVRRQVRPPGASPSTNVSPPNSFIRRPSTDVGAPPPVAPARALHRQTSDVATATASTEERISHLETTNAALVELTEDLLKRIVALEQIIASKN